VAKRKRKGPRKPFTPPFTPAERIVITVLQNEKLQRAGLALERKTARKRRRS
jgi:hypothetical protein